MIRTPAVPLRSDPRPVQTHVTGEPAAEVVPGAIGRPVAPAAAVPFVIRREHAIVRGWEVTATREDAHGLLRLEAGRIVAQWSTARVISRAGSEVWTDRQLGPVEQVALPLAGMAGARVRWRVLPWPPRWQLVLRAADLTAFDALAGEARLLLEHPAELVLDLRRADRALAREFAADVALALAERSLQAAERQASLAPGGGVPFRGYDAR